MKALGLTIAVIGAFISGSVMWLAVGGNQLGGEPFATLMIAAPLDAADGPYERRKTPAALPRLRAHDQDSKSAIIGKRQRPKDMSRLAGASQDDERIQSAKLATIVTKSGAMATPVRVGAPVTGDLQPENDGGLLERTSFGLLPRISRDGLLPARAYANTNNLHAARGKPKIAILFTGLGLDRRLDKVAIHELPAAVTLAFSPYGPVVSERVERARARDHEVMMQLPLEPFDYPQNDPGPYTLLSELDEDANIERLHKLMARFTGYVGMVNHMGGKFAASPKALQPVLRELKSRGLIYLDDGTAPRSATSSIG